MLTKSDRLGMEELLLPVAYLFFSYSSFHLFKNGSSLLEKIDSLFLGKIVGFISSSTLEIYFVQTSIISRFSYLSFPMDFILITILILVSAYVLTSLRENINIHHKRKVKV